MKKPDIYLREYCARLSDENMKFFTSRLGQRLSGDLPEVLNFLSNVKEIDRWLSSADSCFELYDMIDMVYASIEKECEQRFSPA